MIQNGLILVGQYDSPVTRRVAIALHHYGMAFSRDTRSIFSQADEVAEVSPLTRIPALVLPGGEVLIDSAAILDHLDEGAGDRALIPTDGPERRRVLQMTALAQGTLEKAGAVVYERHFHPVEHQSAEWLARCIGQTRAGLDHLTARLSAPHACGSDLTHADAMITTLIWYLGDRLPEVLDAAAHAPLLPLPHGVKPCPPFAQQPLARLKRCQNPDKARPSKAKGASGGSIFAKMNGLAGGIWSGLCDGPDHLVAAACQGSGQQEIT